jgi:hypothetical protein
MGKIAVRAGVCVSLVGVDTGLISVEHRKVLFGVAREQSEFALPCKRKSAKALQ